MIPDQLDEAFEIEERQRQAAIHNAMSVTGNERLTGYCQWCKEPTHGIVCSAECRDDMNKAERFGK